MGKGGSSVGYSGNSSSATYAGSSGSGYGPSNGPYKGATGIYGRPLGNGLTGLNGFKSEGKYNPPTYLNKTYNSLKPGILISKNYPDSGKLNKSSDKYAGNNGNVYGNPQQQYPNQGFNNRLNKKNSNLENEVSIDNIILGKNGLNSKEQLRKIILLKILGEEKRDYNFDKGSLFKGGFFSNNDINSYEELKICPLCGKPFLFCECSKN